MLYRTLSDQGGADGWDSCKKSGFVQPRAGRTPPLLSASDGRIAVRSRRSYCGRPSARRRQNGSSEMRSLPEKTFEHWASLYLASRFPRSEQWWPSRGEDIALALRSQLGNGPGKRLLLELKVPEVTAAGLHEVRIGRVQRDEHLRRRWPVFYVLPLPWWAGSLGPSAHGGPVPDPAASWWRRRAGFAWFGRWTFVMSAADVALSLPPGVMPTLYSYRPGCCVTLCPACAPYALLAHASAWPDFWRAVQTCGSSPISWCELRGALATSMS